MALRFDRATFADLESLLLLMKKMQVADPWSEPFEESIVRSNLAQLLQNPAPSSFTSRSATTTRRSNSTAAADTSTTSVT